MRTLFLSALPYRTDETLIREWLTPFGDIGSIEIHADWQEPTFEPYAIVEIQNVEEAVRALDGKKMGATYLRANERKALCPRT